MAEEDQRASTRTGAEQAKSLDKLTDHVEQNEISGVDSSSIAEAMAAFSQQQRQRREAAAALERRLAVVKVSPADTELLARELELETKDADRALREHGGDLRATLDALIGA